MNICLSRGISTWNTFHIVSTRTYRFFCFTLVIGIVQGYLCTGVDANLRKRSPKTRSIFLRTLVFTLIGVFILACLRYSHFFKFRCSLLRSTKKRSISSGLHGKTKLPLCSLNNKLFNLLWQKYVTRARDPTKIDSKSVKVHDKLSVCESAVTDDII